MRLAIVPLVLAVFLVVGSTTVYANSNQAAAEKIAASLGDQFPGYDIAVSYQNGKVKLVGQVGSPDMMNQAVEHVKHISGIKVTDVDNGLRVAGYPAGLQPVPAQAAPQVVKNVPGPVAATPAPAKRSVWSPQPKQPLTAPPIPSRQEPTKALVAQANNPARNVQPQYSQPQYPQPQYPQQQYAQQQHAQPQYAQPGNPYGQPYAQPYEGQPQQVVPVAYQQEAYGPQGPLPGQYNQPNVPDYAWPSYASYPNYAEVCYPKQYSPKAWPYIGPFYPYPQAPLGWRKTTLEWHDGWWWLDFDDGSPNGPFSPLFRQPVRYTY